MFCLSISGVRFWFSLSQSSAFATYACRDYTDVRKQIRIQHNKIGVPRVRQITFTPSWFSLDFRGDYPWRVAPKCFPHSTVIVSDYVLWMTRGNLRRLARNSSGYFRGFLTLHVNPSWYSSWFRKKVKLQLQFWLPYVRVCPPRKPLLLCYVDLWIDGGFFRYLNSSPTRNKDAASFHSWIEKIFGSLLDSAGNNAILELHGNPGELY